MWTCVRKYRAVLGAQIPFTVLLWLLANEAILYAGRGTGSAVRWWLPLHLGMCGTWLISGVSAAFIGAGEESSCRSFLRALASRTGYALASAISATCLVGLLAAFAWALRESWIGVVLLAMSLGLSAALLFAGAAASARKDTPVVSARSSLRLVRSGAGIAILLVPFIVALGWRPVVNVALGGVLSTSTVANIVAIGVGVINGVTAAVMGVFVWSRLCSSHRLTAVGSGARCVVAPTAAILAALVGAVLHAASYEALPRAFLSLGYFPWPTGIPSVINIPFSIGSLFVAAFGVIVISWMNNWALTWSVASVVLARMVFVRGVTGTLPHVEHGQIAGVLGKTACFWPGYYVAGLAVYATLTVVCVAVARWVRRRTG